MKRINYYFLAALLLAKVLFILSIPTLYGDEVFHVVYTQILSGDLHLVSSSFNFTYPFGYHAFLSLFLTILPLAVVRFIVPLIITALTFLVLSRLFRSKDDLLAAFISMLPMVFFYNSFLTVEPMFFLIFLLTIYLVKIESRYWWLSFGYLLTLKFFTPLTIVPILIYMLHRKNRRPEVVAVCAAAFVFFCISFYFAVTYSQPFMGPTWIDTVDDKTVARWLLPFFALFSVWLWNRFKDKRLFKIFTLTNEVIIIAMSFALLGLRLYSESAMRTLTLLSYHLVLLEFLTLGMIIFLKKIKETEHAQKE